MSDPVQDVPFPVRSTPVPNELIDQAMPLLRDTELRVLLVIARSTLGWKGSSPGKRRGISWISHSELKRRSGRQSEAISRAVSRLISLGLIQVESVTGDNVLSSGARRRSQGRLLYRLGPIALPRN
jgi:hypothetical protein